MPEEANDQRAVFFTNGTDTRLAKGFVQLPIEILRRPSLSASAKCLYADLLSYAWQQRTCYPSQDRLAEDMAVTERTVRNGLRELSDAGLVIVHRHGLQRPNTYELPPAEDMAAIPDRKNSSGPDRKCYDRQEFSAPDRKEISGEVYSGRSISKNHSSSERQSLPSRPSPPVARGRGNAGMPKATVLKEPPAVETPATATEAAEDAGGEPSPPVPLATPPVDAAEVPAEERGGVNPQSTSGDAPGGVSGAARHQDAKHATPSQASLFGPQREGAGTPSAQGRTPSKDAAGRPDTHSILRRHAALFAEKIGSSMALNWAKDGALAKKLLRVYEAETVEDLQDRFFAQGPDSYAARVGFTFGEFYREVPALLVAEKKEHRRRHLTKDQERSKTLLLQQQMAPDTAADLALRFSYADIRRQVRAMGHRKGIKNPAGALKRSIEESWPVPEEAQGGGGRYRPYPLPESEATAHAP